MLKRVALVTSREHPDLPADDRLLVGELARRGIDASARVWDEPGADWPSFDASVLRSTWDYHLRFGEFLRWVEARADEGSPLWNPAPLLRWNMHKFYLRELEARGVSIVPTRFVPAGSPLDLARLLAEEGWERAVVKPAVSATAHRTLLVESTAVGNDDIPTAPDDTLVQKYLPEIESEGEWSFVYFDGDFSHAVRKVPARGDFRVQEEFGGRAEPALPSADLVRQAAIAIAAIDSPWIYARVDGVVAQGRLRLMELELVEPSLFLSADPGAARRFADAIERRVKVRSSSPAP